MLVLTRKQQEKICIGDGITITVLKMKGKSVRLGIDAPAEVKVIRGELRFEDDRQTTPESDTGSDQIAAETATAPSQAQQARVRESNWVSNASAVLQRVPRAEADKLRGPLRTMLDRRVVS
jgi:carbon storage regulator CsrA